MVRKLVAVICGVSVLSGCDGGAGGATEPVEPRPTTFEKADAWNFPNDNYFICVTLNAGSAPLRYSDGTPISAAGAYRVQNTWGYDGAENLEKGFCRTGQVRLDAHEALQTAQGLLVFHKGGQGYEDSRTPYGHLLASDVQEAAALQPQRPTDQPPEAGAPSAIPGTNQWDWYNRNGRGCTPTGEHDYRVRIVRQGAPDELPSSWQYKPNQRSSRFNKYADAGAEQAEGTEHYAYLVWSWLHRGDGATTSPGGGQVRALLRDGQPFYRCGIDSIYSIAYASESTAEAGRVTAIYGKTRASADGPWVYGWAIYAHRPRNPDGSYGATVYHMTPCPDGGC